MLSLSNDPIIFADVVCECPRGGGYSDSLYRLVRRGMLDGADAERGEERRLQTREADGRTA